MASPEAASCPRAGGHRVSRGWCRRGRACPKPSMSIRHVYPVFHYKQSAVLAPRIPPAPSLLLHMTPASTRRLARGGPKRATRNHTMRPRLWQARRRGALSTHKRGAETTLRPRRALQNTGDSTQGAKRRCSVRRHLAPHDALRGRKVLHWFFCGRCSVWRCAALARTCWPYRWP